MKIKMLKLGHSAREIDVPSGSTIADALETADVGYDGYSIALNGLGASSTTSVSDGDVLTLVPKVEGGR